MLPLQLNALKPESMVVVFELMRVGSLHLAHSQVGESCLSWQTVPGYLSQTLSCSHG